MSGFLKKLEHSLERELDQVDRVVGKVDRFVDKGLYHTEETVLGKPCDQ